MFKAFSEYVLLIELEAYKVIMPASLFIAPLVARSGISIQMKCHMLELTFISTVSFQTPLEIGMHSLQLESPLLKVLTTLSLDSHHL